MLIELGEDILQMPDHQDSQNGEQGSKEDQHKKQ